MNDAHLLQLLQRIDPTIVRVPHPVDMQVKRTKQPAFAKCVIFKVVRVTGITTPTCTACSMASNSRYLCWTIANRISATRPQCGCAIAEINPRCSNVSCLTRWVNGEMLVNDKWHDNITCPRCRFRHPPGIECTEASAMADGNRRQDTAGTYPTIMTWEGRPVDELSRDELLECVKGCYSELESLRAIRDSDVSMHKLFASRLTTPHE